MALDWHGMFTFDVPFIEIFIRGTITYLFLVMIMRFGMNRAMGSIGISDMLVIVVIADASQNAMAGEYNSITAGLCLVGTIVFWDYLIDWVCYRFPVLENVLQRRTICLVKNGKFLRKNMRSEMITMDELMSQLRTNGADDVKKVKKACIEANGEVSVIKYDE